MSHTEAVLCFFLLLLLHVAAQFRNQQQWPVPYRYEDTKLLFFMVLDVKSHDPDINCWKLKFRLHRLTSYYGSHYPSTLVVLNVFTWENIVPQTFSWIFSEIQSSHVCCHAVAK